MRFLEGAGSRGALELVGDEILELVRGGTDPAAIAIVAPSLERWRAPLETTFGGLGIPYAIEGRLRLGQTSFGSALLSLLRFAWLGGGRHDLYAFMRSPYSGLRRDHVDFLEGRLRGRAIRTPERVEQETLKLRGQPLPFLDALRAGGSNHEAASKLAASMLAAAHGLGGPPVSDSARLDLRAYESTARTLEELDAWRELDGRVDAEDVVYALERAHVGGGQAQLPGRVAVLDMLRARTRHYEIVFMLGLDEGALPRRSAAATLLDDDARREVEERSRRARVVRPDPVAADRYLFYTACTRPTRRLYLVRRGSHRRRVAARAESVLGRRPLALRAGGRLAVDEATRALRGDVAGRASADGAGAHACHCRTGDDGCGGHDRPRPGERLGSPPRPGTLGVLETDAAHPAGRRSPARSTWNVRRHRAGALRGLLVDVVRRACHRPAADRRAGRRSAARPGRPPGPVPALLGAAQADRLRPRGGGAARRHARVPR